MILKHSLLFITFILINTQSIFACGPWYPYGEETRFSLFSPEIHGSSNLSPFFFSANYYHNINDYEAGENKNINAWFEYCDGNVTAKVIKNTVYQLLPSDFESPLSSQMLEYLDSNNDQEAIEYLLFAKSCSRYNGVTYDPWERDESDIKKQRKVKIKHALQKINATKKEYLQQRYAFLALRLSFYNENEKSVREIYNDYFKVSKNSIVDYWAEYFYLQYEESGPYKNFRLAQLFVQAPSKSLQIQRLFDSNIDIHLTLQQAKNNTQKSNIQLLYNVRKKDVSFDALKTTYSYTQESDAFIFLLTREINKIEDWILTPQYTYFPSSTKESFYSENKTKLYQERINSDTKYALKLANWLNSLPLKSNFIAVSTAHLYFIAGKNSLALSSLKLISNEANEEIISVSNQISILIDIRLSKNKELVLKRIKNFVNKDEDHFILACAREFEKTNFKSISALLFSQINNDFYGRTSTWKAEPSISSLQRSNFYYEYFNYLDSYYTIQETQSLIDYILDNNGNWLTSKGSHDLGKIYDLLGTKYIRNNEITNAKLAFKQVPDSILNSDINQEYLNSNPFYTDFYTEHNGSKADTISFNKLQIATILDSLIYISQSPTQNNKAKVNFLIANCYLNMSYYGNSWRMTRYWWSSSEYSIDFSKNVDYYTCSRAKEYYLKANSSTLNRQTKALCLRMAGRCEKYALMNQNRYDWNKNYDDFGGYHGYIFSKNTYYKLLKNNYPEYEEELISNCESFSKYYRTF